MIALIITNMSNEYDHYCSGLQYDSDFGWEGILESEYEYQTDPEPLVELYVGLKDKNGKEIYVGDIIRIDSMDELRVGYVDLVNDQYCIVCGVDEDGYKIVAEFYYYSKPEENCEVIGNIHENPELLEGKE